MISYVGGTQIHIGYYYYGSHEVNLKKSKTKIHVKQNKKSTRLKKKKKRNKTLY
jgi:hypothetical protein